MGNFPVSKHAWNCVQSGKREVCQGKEEEERKGEGEVRRLCMCVCVHMCVCVCVLVVYVCMSVYMCMYVCTYVYMHMNVCVCVHVKFLLTGTSIIGTIHLATTITPSLAASPSLPGRSQVHAQRRVSSKLCTRVNFH